MANLDPIYVKNLALIGKTVTEAENYLKDKDFILRVVEIDKVSLMVPAKLVENRINVAINSANQTIYNIHGAY